MELLYSHSQTGEKAALFLSINPLVKCHRHCLGQQNRFLLSCAVDTTVLVMGDEKNYPFWMTWKYFFSFQTFGPFNLTPSSSVDLGDLGCRQKEWDCFTATEVSFVYSSGFKQTYEQITWATENDGMFLQWWSCCRFTAVLRPIIPFQHSRTVWLTHTANDCIQSGQWTDNQLDLDHYISEVHGKIWYDSQS